MEWMERLEWSGTDGTELLERLEWNGTDGTVGMEWNDFKMYLSITREATELQKFFCRRFLACDNAHLFTLKNAF
ncbi:hypothetical protein BpHYR1_030495 [Brachionus plicatilis]|uniref:Uncharacterized protein n=1 Tax=Brachionus plicatilis TaxID=10195 RepID=A0A3M7R833_BRAPC|nr:hypothetical protein BpHYR1_030495 [Brachionus plicatilis]